MVNYSIFELSISLLHIRYNQSPRYRARNINKTNIKYREQRLARYRDLKIKDRQRTKKNVCVKKAKKNTRVSDGRSRIDKARGGKRAQQRFEWRSTTESRDYSRINSLLVYVGTGVGFYELVWAVVSLHHEKPWLKRKQRTDS